jgi:hypothetical protein
LKPMIELIGHLRNLNREHLRESFHQWPASRGVLRC